MKFLTLKDVITRAITSVITAKRRIIPRTTPGSIMSPHSKRLQFAVRSRLFLAIGSASFTGAISSLNSSATAISIFSRSFSSLPGTDWKLALYSCSSKTSALTFPVACSENASIISSET